MDDLFWASASRLDRLDEALELRRGLLQHGESDATSWRYINNLAATCMARFARDGRMADLHAAVTAWKRLYEMLPNSSEDMPAILHNLAEALTDLGSATETTGPLYEARSLLREALHHPATSSEFLRPRIERAYADALLAESGTHDSLPSRNARAALARQYAEAAFSGASNTGIELQRTRVTLANALVAEAEVTSDLSLARTACEHYSEAIRNLDAGSPNQVSYRCALASTRLLVARGTNDAEDVNRAITDARLVWDPAIFDGVVIDRVRFALQFGRWAVERHDYPAAVDTLNRAMVDLLKMIPNQLGRRDKEAWLAIARTVPDLAAYADVRLGLLPEAIVAMESGRAVLLTEALSRRTPFG
jgi:tetratricopeptide (TPR) repeat protein